ncbi:hypothetical protein D9611_010551 [Ephemerocybe angulata]|uniref:Uncharacterized protein n=1 Tax=Ephemerocybe angulata TaxID=980116 RepID=A0A8H5FAY6_9AGAR|nr:hypothetical protein D9611_010551 [Tulosesus angulatus]
MNHPLKLQIINLSSSGRSVQQLRALGQRACASPAAVGAHWLRSPHAMQSRCSEQYDLFLPTGLLAHRHAVPRTRSQHPCLPLRRRALPPHLKLGAAAASKPISVFLSKPTDAGVFGFGGGQASSGFQARPNILPDIGDLSVFLCAPALQELGTILTRFFRLDISESSSNRSPIPSSPRSSPADI